MKVADRTQGRRNGCSQHGRARPSSSLQPAVGDWRRRLDGRSGARLQHHHFDRRPDVEKYWKIGRMAGADARCGWQNAGVWATSGMITNFRPTSVWIWRYLNARAEPALHAMKKYFCRRRVLQLAAG